MHHFSHQLGQQCTQSEQARHRVPPQAAEREARRKSAESHAASLQQRDARLAQIEELKDRILADRCGPCQPLSGERHHPTQCVAA